MLRGFLRRACALVMAFSLLSASSALAAPITNDTNLQYFNYNGRTMALVGTSASYLCHVTQPDREDSYCTWENRVSFLNDLQGKGLNKIRLWLALNHSPGSRPIDSPGTPTHNDLTPYTYEQPFKWDPVNKFWNLDVWEQGFFDRVSQVVSDAQSRGIIVEVTLFDGFLGAFENSPWNDRNNSPQGVNKSLSAEKYFTAYDNVTGDSNLGNQYVRTRQRAFIQKMVSTLNSFDNFYWEVSNEPDLANEDMTATINWHKDMIQEIVNAEAPLAKKHMIAVNFSQDQTINWAAMQANIKIIDGHYVAISDFAGRPRNGAVEMIRTFLKPTQAGNVDKTFGFNEGRISPNVTGADENSVRAEAWEFMLYEGGSLDHLGYEWKFNPTSANIRAQLGVLAKFLNGQYSGGVLVTPGLTLTNVSRQIMNPVSWCPDIAAYGTGNTYWGAMQWTRNEYALYIHHSALSTGSFKKYDPLVTSGGYSHNFRLNLGSLAGNFTARWIDPKTGLDVASPHNFFWPANGTLYQLPPSPSYNFDIVLSVRRQ
jgi:hypothetical protein